MLVNWSNGCNYGGHCGGSQVFEQMELRLARHHDYKMVGDCTSWPVLIVVVVRFAPVIVWFALFCMGAFFLI